MARLRSRQNKRDPTSSLALISRYEKRLVKMWGRYRAAVWAAIRAAPRLLESLPPADPIRAKIWFALRAVHRYLEAAPPPPPDLKALQARLQAIADENMIGPLDDVDDFWKAYKQGIDYSVMELKRAGIKPAEGALPVDKAMIANIEAMNLADVTKLTDDMAREIMVTISTALQSQERFGALVDDIDAVLQDGEARARMIARTEVMRGVNTAVKDRYTRAGVSKVEWLVALDDKQCDECEENGLNSPWPIDEVPECPAHPNCRCTLIPVIDIPEEDEEE